ncbi:MAG: glycosyltransferase family 2 protein [Terriglobia bacterium]
MRSVCEISEPSTWPVVPAVVPVPRKRTSPIRVVTKPQAKEVASPALGERRFWEWALASAIVLGLLISLYAVTRNGLFHPMLVVAESRHWTKLMLYPAFLWAVMGTLLLVFRTLLWLRYRPFPSATLHDAPTLTVIIPAYNEGPMVAKSIDSVAAALYPPGRLEILVVDDGSKDDTWEHIQIAAARHPELVTPIRFPRNRGKREALAVGFERAFGEIVVTLDSDSVLEKNGLLAAAGPFHDENVGAVAGRVGVYNRTEGLIPRMLHVRYILSFDLLRAAESTFRTVYCCPGAITAYRVSGVRRVLNKWRNQTFLGSKCTFGEDRALTNYILNEGFDSVYQGSAVVQTVVPTTYSRLCKMFLRWNRSYVREEIRFMGIVWKRPLGSRLFALADRLITNIRYPIGYLSLFLLGALTLGNPQLLLRFLVVAGIASFFNTIYCLRTERSMNFLYGVFYSYYSLLALTWIFPYAFMTVRARSWLTR